MIPNNRFLKFGPSVLFAMATISILLFQNMSNPGPGSTPCSVGGELNYANGVPQYCDGATFISMKNVAKGSCSHLGQLSSTGSDVNFCDGATLWSILGPAIGNCSVNSTLAWNGSVPTFCLSGTLYSASTPSFLVTQAFSSLLGRAPTANELANLLSGLNVSAVGAADVTYVFQQALSKAPTGVHASGLSWTVSANGTLSAQITGCELGYSLANGSCVAHAFRILVDVNQLNPDEAVQATRFAADGVWAIPVNSPAGIDWPTTLQKLNGSTWTVSEDNPANTSQIDSVSQSLGRMVDTGMFYNEDGLATPLSDAQINWYASYVVPGFGPVGRRITLLTRSYANGDPRQAQLNAALQNPNVAGAAFEFNPEKVASLNLIAGCEHILRMGKKCYLLMPPSPGTTDYLSNVQYALRFFAQSPIVHNPNLYVVPATYVRPNSLHYVSNGAGDRNSIEAVVSWLKLFRGPL